MRGKRMTSSLLEEGEEVTPQQEEEGMGRGIHEEVVNNV